jgi:hypothetical protein
MTQPRREPNLDQVRRAMREHDEQREEDQPDREDDAPQDEADDEEEKD